MYLLIRRLSLALAVIVVTATAATLPQPTRTILEQHDQTGVPGKEIVIGTAELPAETAIGFHTHPGDEIGYVLEGTLVVKTRGQPDKVLKAGDSFSTYVARSTVCSLHPVATVEKPSPRGSWTRGSPCRHRFQMVPPTSFGRGLQYPSSA